MAVITKEELVEAYKKKKIGITSKWGIKQHLQSNPQYYTKEARDYLIQIAKERGYSDREIDALISAAGEQSKRNNSWPEMFRQIGFVFLVVLPVLYLCLQLLTSQKYESIGWTVLLLFGVGSFWFMWKRGW